MENFDAGDLTYEELSNLGTTPEQIAQNIKDSQFTKEQEKRAARITSQKIGDKPAVFEGVDETVTQGGKGTQVPVGISYVDDDPVADSTTVDSGSTDPSGGWSDSGNDTGTDSGGSVSDSGYGSSGGPGDFNIGGLAGKKKPKTKKMKRGGLASKK